MADFETMGI